MTSAELAKEVEAIISECTARVLGVGQEQYSYGDKQKFETMPLDELFEFAEEELRDQIVYACMLRSRLRRLRDAVDARFRNADVKPGSLETVPPNRVCDCPPERTEAELSEGRACCEKRLSAYHEDMRRMRIPPYNERARA